MWVLLERKNLYDTNMFKKSRIPSDFNEKVNLFSCWSQDVSDFTVMFDRRCLCTRSLGVNVAPGSASKLSVMSRIKLLEIRFFLTSTETIYTSSTEAWQSLLFYIHSSWGTTKNNHLIAINQLGKCHVRICGLYFYFLFTILCLKQNFTKHFHNRSKKSPWRDTKRSSFIADGFLIRCHTKSLLFLKL